MTASFSISGKKLLQRLVLGIFLMLLVTEGTLWLCFRQGVEPSVRVKYWQEFPGLKRDIVYERNGLGLRTLSIDSWEKPDNVIRIICLGASTTDQGTQNTEDMWMAHLERMLNEAFAGTGKTIQVGAYARGGNKMPQVLAWVNQRLEALSPDVVITLFGLNTLCTEAAIPENVTFDLLRERSIERSSRGRQEQLERFSQIYRYCRQIMANAESAAYLEKNDGLNFDIQGVPAFRHSYWRTPIDHSVPDLPRRTVFFRDATEYLADWLDERGIREVILAQPLLLDRKIDYVIENGRVRLQHDLQEVTREAQAGVEEKLRAIWFVVNAGNRLARMTPGRFREDMDQFNAVQKEIARERGIPFVPLDTMIEASLENFFDDCHFTDLGSRRVAEAIFPQLREVVEKVLVGDGKKQ